LNFRWNEFVQQYETLKQEMNKSMFMYWEEKGKADKGPFYAFKAKQEALIGATKKQHDIFAEYLADEIEKKQ